MIIIIIIEACCDINRFPGHVWWPEGKSWATFFQTFPQGKSKCPTDSRTQKSPKQDRSIQRQWTSKCLREVTIKIQTEA